MNPIEESFSALKHWLRRNWQFCAEGDPVETLLHACRTAVTAEKARGWIAHAGYLSRVM